MQENSNEATPWIGTWKGTELFAETRRGTRKENQKSTIVTAADNPNDHTPSSRTDSSVQEAPEPKIEDYSSTGQERRCREEIAEPNETHQEFTKDDEENLPTSVEEPQYLGNAESRDNQLNQSTGDYEHNIMERPLFLCLRCIGCGCCTRLPRRWPRTFWLFFGVVAPLWVLISISGICGYGLVILEAPNEIKMNNEWLQTKYQLEAASNVTQRIIAATPEMCMKLYAWNQTQPENYVSGDANEGDNYFDLAIRLEPALIDLLNQTFNNDDWASKLWTINATDMLNFMRKCGQVFQSHISYIESAGGSFILQQGQLTFNWDRCANNTGDGRITVDLPWVGEQTYEALYPQAQQLYFESVWQDDMQSIFVKVYNETLLPNATAKEELEARYAAFKQATENATGEAACEPNIPATAWFFFTIMTTIGYGNQVPETQGGQTMVYTLGFLSILLFAATAANAGYIMTSVFADIMKKAKLGVLSSPIVATIIWGCLYYSWLILIAIVTDNWKRSRLSDYEEFDQGYWFAYISTTTIGLGDIYLEPEVFVTKDLVVFTFIFLIGFVFLASFLGSLGSFIKKVEHGGGKSIPESLEATTICCGHKVVRAGLHVGEKVAKGSYFVGENVVKVGQAVVEAGHQKVKKSMHKS